jgi:hypothetical protein
MHQRCLRVTVRGHQVTIGGWNSRTPEDFAAEFSRWVSDMEEALKQ